MPEKSTISTVRDVALECGAIFEAKKVKPSEVPIVLGLIALALADHCGLPVSKVTQMFSTAIDALDQASKDPSN